MARQHIDQTIRTRNFKARNERIETGVLVKSQKGETSAKREKWENAFKGRPTGSVQKETLVVSTTGLILVNGHNAPLAPTQTDGREPYIFRPPRGASPAGLKGRKPCRNFLKGKCTESPCDLRHPPVCLIYKSESACKYGDKCTFLHTKAGGQPSKESKKGGAKG